MTRARRAFQAGAALVAAVSIGAGGCGGMGHPRDDDITGAIDGLWDAMQVDADDVTTSPYRRETKRDIAACEDLTDDDRWIAYRTSQLPGGVHPQDELWERSTAHLDDDGFEVRRYRDGAGDVFELYATKGEMAVYLEVLTNGYTHLRVVAGPCAALMDHEPLPGMTSLD